MKRSAYMLGVSSMSGWMSQVAAATESPAKSVILLWLNGGPSTIDLWDLKPDHENGGSFRPIETSVSGIRISEHLPRLADWMRDMALIRSMRSPEGDHNRASYLLRTGYRPQAGIQFPAVGASLAQEMAVKEGTLPRFVSIAPSRLANSIGAGFLSPSSAPFRIGRAGGTIENLHVADLKPSMGSSDLRLSKRLEMLRQFESGSLGSSNHPITARLRDATDRAQRLMEPSAASVFDLAEETETQRDAYGRNQFGQGCLLARRLVERGVPFVEVTLDGWDTHRENFVRTADLSNTLDTAFATLLSDLKQRGLLDSTLVVCQGEFGRTPKINQNGGRDHWPHAWSVAMAGGGIAGGQAIGGTSRDGTEVVDRPISVPDLVATVAKLVGVDPKKQNMSNVDRPIRIADPYAEPIGEII